MRFSNVLHVQPNHRRHGEREPDRVAIPLQGRLR